MLSGFKNILRAIIFPLLDMLQAFPTVDTRFHLIPD